MLTLNEPRLAMLKSLFVALLSFTLLFCAVSGYGFAYFNLQPSTEPPEDLPAFYWYVLSAFAASIVFLVRAFFGVLAKYQKSMEDRIKDLKEQNKD